MVSLKRVFLGLLALFLMGLSLTGHPAAAGRSKTTSSTIAGYSYMGIQVWSLSVTGYYTSNGTSIEQYGETFHSIFICSICFLYSLDQVSSSWAYRTPAGGMAQASATLSMGINLAWIKLTFGSHTVTVRTFATP